METQIPNCLNQYDILGLSPRVEFYTDRCWPWVKTGFINIGASMSFDTHKFDHMWNDVQVRDLIRSRAIDSYRSMIHLCQDAIDKLEKRYGT